METTKTFVKITNKKEMKRMLTYFFKNGMKWDNCRVLDPTSSFINAFPCSVAFGRGQWDFPEQVKRGETISVDTFLFNQRKH